MKGVLYAAVRKISEHIVQCDVETAVVLFVLDFLGGKICPVIFVPDDECEGFLKLNVNNFNYDVRSKVQIASYCHLPILWESESKYCVAGLCSVLRKLVKSSGREWIHLLGYHEACLSACSESSNWTKFCEVDVVNAAKSSVRGENNLECCLEVLAWLEEKLSLTFSTRNTQKKGKKSRLKGEAEVGRFFEGSRISLSDLIVFPCIGIILEFLGSISSTVLNWFNDVSENLPKNRNFEMFFLDGKTFVEERSISFGEKNSKIIIGNDLLAKACGRLSGVSGNSSIPNLGFTNQAELDECFDILRDSIFIDENFYSEENDDVNVGKFHWENVPREAKPDDYLPASRLEKKRQQIENVVAAVLKMVQKGDKIVEFCCGAGHVGLLLAAMLPDHSVILLDNKEYSLKRAKKRAKDMGLENLAIVQSNINHFQETYNIGISLHACGTATDLVLNHCISNGASFVVVPCCYGAIKPHESICYPKSELSQYLNLRQYRILSHCADQSQHDAMKKDKDQGEKCMRIIDTDRCLHAAKGKNYKVCLSKMKPETCTTKNNIISGSFVGNLNIV